METPGVDNPVDRIRIGPDGDAVVAHVKYKDGSIRCLHIKRVAHESGSGMITRSMRMISEFTGLPRNEILRFIQPPGHKFPLGKLVITAGFRREVEGYAKDCLNIEDLYVKVLWLAESIRQHSHGNWGDLDAEDAAIQDTSLENHPDCPVRLMSIWFTPDGKKYWIITEWDRSITTILFPEEY